MKGFFEILNFKGGFGKISRMNLIQERKVYIHTPKLIVPLNDLLFNDKELLDFLKNYDLFKILNLDELKEINFFHEQFFKDKGFFFSNSGTFETFQDNLEDNLIKEKINNVFLIIPFNVPTTAISLDFAISELQNYLSQCENLFKKYQNLDFGLSIKFFDNISLLDYYVEFIKKHKNIKALNFLDLFDNLKNFRNIIKVIVAFRKELDNNLLYIASGKILPKYYPMLVYLGFDVIDATYLFILSSDNFYNLDEKLIPLYKMKFLPCSCKFCQSISPEMLQQKKNEEDLVFLYRHNLLSALSYMNKVKQYLATEDFRELVEKSSLNDSYLTSMLKVLDKAYFETIRQYTPLYQKLKKVNCLSELSFYRPDFHEFRRRIVSNFIPEKFTKVIVLFPCSAKKPYSSSKSHKKLLKVLRDTAKSKFPKIQEFILTSPLGVIPRQLENIYPANSYDISVTGLWSEEEIQITSDILIAFLSKYPNAIPIIAHVEENYRSIIERAQKHLQFDIYYTDTSMGITNEKALISLEKMIEKFIGTFDVKEKTPILSKKTSSETRKISAIIDYYFGKNFSKEIITKNVKIIRHKNKDLQFVYDKNTNKLIGKFRQSTGQIFLTVKSVEDLLPLEKINNFIVFNGDLIKGNTIFRPGILEYGSDLQPNDLVVILNNSRDKVIGMGTMLVGTNFIKNSKTGRIVDIYESNK